LSTPATTPLSYNGYIQQIGVMAVVVTQDVAGVWQGVDPAFNSIVPQMLNYSEARIQRDLDFLQSQTSNTYTLIPGNPVFSIPIDDFLTIQTLEVTQTAGSTLVNTTPLLPVSKEFIQNCYSGVASAGTPQYFAPVGDSFGNGGDISNNILLGPVPNYSYTLRVFGTIRMPSLAKYATAGPADTSYTYISEWLPDMLVMASMIYISAFQRNFSATSDDTQMSMSYEKQYQALRLGAIAEENRRKGQASGWSGYSTPTAATPTR
jgi:hypothetical protein